MVHSTLPVPQLDVCAPRHKTRRTAGLKVILDPRTGLSRPLLADCPGGSTGEGLYAHSAK
jgi:hypothetical protein